MSGLPHGFPWPGLVVRAHRPEDGVSYSVLLEDVTHRSLWCVTPLPSTYNMTGLLPVTHLRSEWGEGVEEQTNLYKLQSYYIYKAQTEPEPWGTQDGNNLRSRFAWSYAAFERSDTAGGAGRGTGRDAGLHLGDRYHRRFPHHLSLASALTRGRLTPERTGVKVFPVLLRPDSAKGAFGGVTGICLVTSSLHLSAIR